ncbi:MAG: gamma-glutamyltransferase [Planctomycetota bacterium]|nr:gamma-glutamyltransferase [Planctomycetota bacterium]
MKPALPLGVLLMSLVLQPDDALAAERPSGRGFVTRSEVVARNGMACTSHPLATQAAIDVLKAGGSAVDAAIAADACLGLMEPTSCGIGGDLFALVWDASTRKLHGLNGSGRSARKLTLEWFREQKIDRIPKYGPLPVTVPGCVDGWQALHGRFGKVPLARVLAPAIGYARDGFPLSEIIAGDWEKNARSLESYPNFKEIFMPGGRAPRHGEVFRNPGLARTLERIAAGGRDAFYRGEVPAIIAAYLKRQGGFLDEEDFAAHTSDWVEPISTRYRGYDVWEIPPNGQGLSVLQMLNILEGYDLKSMGWGSTRAMHLFIEAKKLAFEDRARHYGDPAFSRIPIRELLDKGYAVERRKLIAEDKAGTRYAAGDVALRQSDTIYLTTADAAGNMVSFIQSNYRGMGSGMTPDGLGFVLHDRGEAFVLKEGHPNVFAPGKRPFHTIIPAFVTREGEPWLSFGVMGGDMQPQGHVQILMNLIDFGMGLQEAGDAPRIYHTGSSEPTGEKAVDGGTVNLEPGFPGESVRDLVRLGHRIGRTSPQSFGGYQAIRVDVTNRVYFGASESRKDGHAAGY